MTGGHRIRENSRYIRRLKTWVTLANHSGNNPSHDIAKKRWAVPIERQAEQ